MKKIFIKRMVYEFLFSGCISNKKDESIPEKNIRVIENAKETFVGASNDWLKWGNEELYHVSLSPLRYFENYEELYQYTWNQFVSSEYTFHDDKPYSCSWIVSHDSLYLRNISLKDYAPSADKALLFEDSINRKMEDFTGVKFTKNTLLFANWFTGNLDIKPHIPEKDSPEWDDFDQFLKWGDFYRFYFEKGILKSIKWIKPRRY